MPKPNIDLRFVEPLASVLDEMRAKARQKHHIAYDCRFNGVTVDDRVFCKKGHRLGRANDGSVSIDMVLKGAHTNCMFCPDYEGEE